MINILHHSSIPHRHNPKKKINKEKGARKLRTIRKEKVTKKKDKSKIKISSQVYYTHPNPKRKINKRKRVRKMGPKMSDFPLFANDTRHLAHRFGTKRRVRKLAAFYIKYNEKSPKNRRF